MGSGHRALPFAVICAGAMLAAPAAWGQAPAATRDVDCAALLPKLRVVGAQRVGPASCRMNVADVELDGQSFTRIDVGLDGTVEGTVAETGNYHEYLTSSPDIVFPQAGNTSPRHQGIATYERAKGASMTILLPGQARDWNGKMWVMVHGRGRAFKLGNLKAWDKHYDPAAPIADLDRYDRLVMKKGFALVKTYRTSAENTGEIQTRLDDGRTVDWAAFNDNLRYIMDFTIVAQNLARSRLGKAPRLTYEWGHSAGARISRDINYTPGINRTADGKPFFAGVLADDPAAGIWLPYVMRDGKDVLFATEESRKDFVPQIEVLHGGYNNITMRVDRSPGSILSPSYLANKRRNAEMLLAKGLGGRFRAYEVRGISHQGGEIVGETKYQNMPLANLMDRFFDMLDAWVDRGVAPPENRSDWAPLGGTTATGEIARPALSLPELACPLGVYYPWPSSTDGNTRFASFDGSGVEPLDEKKHYVDMNRNGAWDFIETPTQAWRRLGLLKPGEQFSRERYVDCVRSAAGALRDQGFMSAAIAADYERQAREAPLPNPRQP